jgi:hypothetical protein
LTNVDPSVARRLEAYRRTGDPSTLWPGLAETARIAALHEIERVTRAVLAGGNGVHVDPENVHATYALLIAGHTSGVGSLLGRWTGDGAVMARPDVARGFGDQLAHSRRRFARMSREVGPALDALTARGVKPVVLKGFHTSRTYFEEPGVRRMADVDLFVSPAAVDTAEDALRQVGFRPATGSLHPHKRDWIGPTVSTEIFSVECDDERTRWNLELHASLDRVYHPGAVARLDAESEQVEPIEIDGRPLLALRAPLLLLSAACHCSQELDASRLLRLVEIVRIIRSGQASGDLDWDEVLGMMRRTRAARYAYPALALAEDLAPGTVDARVLAIGRRASTWAARHTVARLVPAGGSPDRRGVLRQMMWTSGSVAVLQRLMRNAWPARFSLTRDVVSGWRARWRRMRAGRLTLGAPDERRVSSAEQLREGVGR